MAGENVGVYGINQGDLALNSGNYDLSYQGNNLTITKALLNVIADAKTKVYGDADPSLTYQVSGLKNGDTAGAVLNGGSLSRVAGENVGVYGINQGGLGLGPTKSPAPPAPTTGAPRSQGELTGTPVVHLCDRFSVEPKMSATSRNRHRAKTFGSG